MAQFDIMNEQEQMQMLMSQLQDSNLRQSVLQYINQTADGLNKDANSKALIETLARESVHNQRSTAIWKSRTKKSVVVGVVAVVLAITVQFLVNYLSNELSKESHIDKQGAMVSTDGKVVKTQMEEMKVDLSGKLVSRDGGSSVKTMPTLARVVLASSLPDSTLMGLDEIVVYSDKGYTLQIKVQGFSRVPVLNSRCGNVVHFYTAWKGKLTLDSTDLSFDEATAAEFEMAGFSLAMGGRRLAGGSKVDGFFKALEVAKASGKWACADVPLPSVPKTRVDETTIYAPCSNQGHCESKFGSYLPGAEKVTGEFATRAAGMYLKTQRTHMISGRYQVTMETMLLHPNQRLAQVFDTQKQLWQTFQLSADNTKSHCDSSTQKETKNKADADMHFEYIGTEEESGLVLRHFRMTRSHDFLVEMVGDAVKTVVTEFWDDGETLLPHRILESDGTVVVFQSMKASVSDAEIEERFGVLLEDCSKNEKETNGIPSMRKFQDLEPEAIVYYKDNFGQSEELLQNAANNDAFAIYLVKASDPLSVRETCKRKCGTEIDDAVVQMQLQQTLTCEEGGHLLRAMNCMREAHHDCSQSNFYVGHQNECWQNSENTTVAERNLQETEEVEESMQFLHNDTLLATRQLGDVIQGMSGGSFGVQCMSKGFMPVQFDFFVKTTWPSGRSSYALPWCLEMQLDEDGKPVLMSSGQTAVAEKQWKMWKRAYRVAKKAADEKAKAAAEAAAKLAGKKIEQQKNEAKFILRLTWSLFAEPGIWPKSVRVGIDIMGRACIAAKWIFAALNPPFYAKLCTQASIGIVFGVACPDRSPVRLTGKLKFSFSMGLDLIVCWIEGIKIELGVEAGLDGPRVMTICKKVLAAEGPTRRRYWDRRRAAKRVCNKKTYCDVYVKGWVTLKFTIVKMTVDLTYWMDQRKLESFFYAKVQKVWEWSWEWETFYERQLWEYLF